MKRLIKGVMTVCLVACLSVPVLAQQEQMDVTKIQNIPDFGAQLPVAQYESESNLFEEFPPGDEALAFRVRLPKTWTKAPSTLNMTHKKEEVEKAALSQRILGQIAKYFGPGRIGALSRFEVQAMALDYEVTAKNWFMQEILLRGYVLEGLKEVSDRRVEGLYVTIEKDVPYVVRAAAEINGARMVVASYYVPDSRFEEERAQQQRAIESFEFITPEKIKIQQTQSYSFLDLLTFEYPTSWRLLAPDIHDLAGMEATLTSSLNDVTLSGEMRLTIIAQEYAESVPEELKYQSKLVEERGLFLGDLIETRNEFRPPEHVKYIYTEVYEAKNEEQRIQPHEFWIAVMEEERYFYIVTMLTPGRQSEFYTWAQNIEAFKIVVESFQP